MIPVVMLMLDHLLNSFANRLPAMPRCQCNLDWSVKCQCRVLLSTTTPTLGQIC